MVTNTDGEAVEETPCPPCKQGVLVLRSMRSAIPLKRSTTASYCRTRIPTGTICRPAVRRTATGARTVSARAERTSTGKMQNGGHWPPFFLTGVFPPPSSGRGQETDLVQQ